MQRNDTSDRTATPSGSAFARFIRAAVRTLTASTGLLSLLCVGFTPAARALGMETTAALLDAVSFIPLTLFAAFLGWLLTLRREPRTKKAAGRTTRRQNGAATNTATTRQQRRNDGTIDELAAELLG